MDNIVQQIKPTYFHIFTTLSPPPDTSLLVVEMTDLDDSSTSDPGMTAGAQLTALQPH